MVLEEMGNWLGQNVGANGITLGENEQRENWKGRIEDGTLRNPVFEQ